MANALYTTFKEKLMRGVISLDSRTIRAMLVKNTYAADLANEVSIASIIPHRIGAAVALTDVAVVGGVLRATNPRFLAAAAGSVSNAVVLYSDFGSDATSVPILYLDTIAGFPMATSGTDVEIEFGTGPLGIFAL